MNRLPTLSDMIASAIQGSEEDDLDLEPSAETRTQEKVAQVANFDLESAEKVAQVAEFIGRRGVASFLKRASSQGTGPTEVNDGPNPKNTAKKQVGPHGGAPPMKPPPDGKIPNNESSKPGGGAGSVSTQGKEQGTHVSALGSNQAAIDFNKKLKAQRVSPSLAAVLDTTPFADPKLKEMLSHTESDKNIHSKSASEHDSEAIKAEVVRRLNAKREVANA